MTARTPNGGDEPEREPKAEARARSGRWPARVLYAAVFALAAAWCARLSAEAASAVFGTDECFHAWVAQWIAQHGRLPETIESLYGGFAYFYQPLLHLVGAAGFALLGEAGLRFLPLAAAAGVLLAVAAGARGAVPAAARAWTVLLLVASGLFATWAVRLYAESLSALVLTGGALALVVQQRRGGRGWTILLGVLAGLAILAKWSGWALPALLAIAAAVRAVHGEAAPARSLAAALGIGLLVAAPWLIRNQVLFGSALYPLGATDVDPGLLALHRTRFSIPPPAFFSGLPRLLGPIMVALAAMAALAVVIERRWTVRESVWAFALAGIVATAFMPVAAARHLVAFLPLLALGSAWIVADAFGRRGTPAWPVSLALIAAATWTLVRAPDHRAGASPPPALMEAFEAVARVTPEDATVLSLWTYDTFYHGRRAATWPVPWGQSASPAPLFTTKDPARFAAALDSLGIGYVLAPKSAPLEPWNGSNYPDTFVTCLRVLMESGRIQVAWQSDRFVLLRRE